MGQHVRVTSGLPVPTQNSGGRRNSRISLVFGVLSRGRLANRVQITSDGHRPYLQAVDTVFGQDADCAILHKICGADPQAEKRYSPAKCIGTEKRPMQHAV